MPSWRERLRAFDEQPNLIRVAQFLRRRLPGDKELGDPLSMSGTVVGQRLTDAEGCDPRAGRGVPQVNGAARRVVMDAGPHPRQEQHP